MSLKKLVAFADDAPSCGTRPPRPGPRRFEELVTAEPVPNPWRFSDIEAAFWQSIRLYQVGQRLEQIKGTAAELGAQVTSSAATFFDDWCGSVPLSVLLQWLLHHPPPPPPWLETVIAASTNSELAATIGGEFGKQLGSAAAGLIAANLPRSR